MKTKLQRRLGLAGLLLVSPALLAAKGCSFGADDVPLGSNGEAGAAGDDGGTDPDAGSGGTTSSAGTGGAGITSGAGGANASGTGGTTSSAGVGGTSGGNSAGAGGAADPTTDEPPCFEELTPIGDWSETPLGFSAQAALSFLGGKRAAAQYLITGGSSTLEFELVRAELFYVESTGNPDFPLDIVVSCENHVRAVGVARFESSDGRFHETLHDFVLTVDYDESMSEFVAGGAITLERDQLRGSYQPAIEADQCFLAMQFNIGFTESDLGGSFIESILNAPCGSDEPNLAVIGRDAGGFACNEGMDCAPKPPEPTAVVEASSCEALGMQQTGEGDESTFAVDAAVITRAEDWGCGCPQFPEFVLAFAPSSPVELRLCHDDFVDSCEAACSAELSYDLSKAFDIAGTTDFRFVD
jgi:hypothetical protein